MMVDLRKRLRLDTRHAHESVDLAFQVHDPACYPGYVGFLCAHWLSLDVLRSDATLPTQLHEDVARDLRNIECDLRHLGCMTPTPLLHERRAYHSLAVEYLLIGSSLGLRVTTRRWEASPDPRVLTTAYFLNGVDRSGHWKPFCERLLALPAHGDVADTIVADSKRIFEIYKRAAKRSAAMQKDRTIGGTQSNCQARHA